jgi:protein-tyrosine-phosphatase
MAEGFARKYWSDVMECDSAGLSPAPIVQPLTKKVMEEKNVNIDAHFPKDLSSAEPSRFDLLINMSGVKLPARIPIEVREWKVEDPIGRSEEFYIVVRDQIEQQVMQLILEFRRDKRRAVATEPGPSGSRNRLGRRR